MLKYLLITTFVSLSLAFATQADELLASGNYDEALGYYQQEWQADPTNPEIREKISICGSLQNAKVFFETGDYDSAEKIYLNLPPQYLPPEDMRKLNTVMLLRKKTVEAYNNGDYAQASENFRALAEINPTNPEYSQGQKYIAKIAKDRQAISYLLYSGQWEQAQSALQNLWAANPEDPMLEEIARGLKSIQKTKELTNESKYDEALEALALSNQIFRNNPALGNELLKIHSLKKLEYGGDRSLQAGHPDQAEIFYRKAYVINSDNQILAKKLENARNLAIKASETTIRL